MLLISIQCLIHHFESQCGFEMEKLVCTCALIHLLALLSEELYELHRRRANALIQSTQKDAFIQSLGNFMEVVETLFISPTYQ